MQTQIRWNTKELTKDLPEDESGFYKAIGELLPEIEIPNRLHISCHMGDAEFLLKQRGTYTKNGEVKPSLYVTEEYNNIYGLTPSIYSDAYLTCINPESNKNIIGSDHQWMQFMPLTDVSGPNAVKCSERKN